MPTLVRENIDNVNAIISVTIEKSDYEKDFNAKLKDLQKRGIKGFRKGKVPRNVLLKFYGKSLLQQLINDLLQKEITDYLVKKKPNFLGNLLPVEDKMREYNPQKLQDYNFKYEMGLYPDFEVEGITKENVFERYDITIPDELAQNQWTTIKGQSGQNVDIEDSIEENDIVTFKAVELEGDEAKEEGVEAEFKMLVKIIADEAVKEELLTKKAGDSIRFNVFDLEEKKQENHENFVRKHLLGLADDDEREVGENFEAEITKVSRYEAPEINQEFFDKFFGEGAVKSEEEAINFIQETIKGSYAGQVDGILLNDIRAHLLEENAMDLPVSFMRKWLERQNAPFNGADRALEYDMRWTLIKSDLTQRFGIKEPTEAEVRSFTAQLFANQYGIQDPNFVEQQLQNASLKSNMANEITNLKVLNAVKSQITVIDKPISVEEFQAILNPPKEADINTAASQEEE